MNPRKKPSSFSIILLGLVIAACVWSPAGGGEDRPNLIFLLADDQRSDALGCAGNETVVTPNLDRLAAEGTLFVNAYLTSPICEPSRAGIMLGQYQGTHRCGFDRPTNLTITKEEFARSYPVLLRKAGYFTGFVGKFGFPVSTEKKANDGLGQRTWERRERRGQFWKMDAHMPSGEFDVWHGFAGQGRYFPRGEGGDHLTKIMGDQACDFLRQARRSGKSFCLSVSFKAPHGPNTPDPAYRGIHEGKRFEKPRNFGPKFRDGLAEVVRNHYRGRKGLAENRYRDFMDKYYGLIHGIDVVIGRLRTQLDELGLAGSTVIVYTSDNGYFCGSKGLAGKDLLYEESLRTPLIIYDPRLPSTRRGRKVTQLASAVDFAPTLLDLAGLDAPSSMAGRSLVPLLNEDRPPWRDAIYAENFFTGKFMPALEHAGERADVVKSSSVRSRAVRTERWKYVQYYELAPMIEELYDLEKDPLETKNLSSDPGFSETLAELRKRCQKFVRGL